MNISKAKKNNRYVAFLRGINIGGNVLIKMDELRGLFESLGYKNVKTILASGNVVFNAAPQKTATLSCNIGLKLKQTFERDIIVFVYPLEVLQELEKSQPFHGLDVTPEIYLLVTFLPEEPGKGDLSVLSQDKDFTIIKIYEKMICGVLTRRPGKATPELMITLEKIFGKSITNRTWGTILKILKVADQDKNT